jgi:hypothetical protein
MYLETIKFKRTKDSDWEQGFYIGRSDNDDKSTILDKNYKPLSTDESSYQIWDSHFDLDRNIEVRIPIQGEFSEDE